MKTKQVFFLGGKDTMKKSAVLFCSGLTVMLSCVFSQAATIQGTVVNEKNMPVEGVMVSAIDAEHRKWTSVFTKPDGSFTIDGLRDCKHQLRTRLMGLADTWLSSVSANTDNLHIQTRPAVGEELELQRPANSAFSMLDFEDSHAKLNFKMMCSYCHQVGTVGFRTPEEPVDWETMLRRMDGFGGLFPHTKETIIPRLMETYKGDAVKQWPTFVPPPAPTGLAAAATITMWEMDELLQGSFHDLELGRDGRVYAVNIQNGKLIALDTESGEQTTYKYPKGAYGPHSIETANDGSLWTTMCASGKMVRFDFNTEQFETYSSAEEPKTRGNYPHTLRINPSDPEGLIWYTDAGSNSCFSIHPTTHVVKEYKLLDAGQATAAGRGESRGITPYGIDFSPVDGMIWYSKLNGNRIGRIDPSVDDGAIKEWNPPFRGPRRLHVAPDGMVWVPGFGSGVFGKFDPTTERWTVYELPDAENQIPYALNIDKDGIVWVCGTGNDTINRFDPVTETLVEFRLPTRVSYTREIEFDDDGNVWTSTSGPARHMERGVGAVICISLPDTLPTNGGTQLIAKTYDGNHDVGNLAVVPKRRPQNQGLFQKIDQTPLPAAYHGKNHQEYVDARMTELSSSQRQQVNKLWQQFRRQNPTRSRDGQMFIRILEHVGSTGLDAILTRKFVKKWKQNYRELITQANHLENRSLDNGRYVFEQAACSRCHSIGGKGAKYGPDLTAVSKRFQGSKLLLQLVNPSQEIHKDFKTQMILVDDGRLLTGLVVNETPDHVEIVQNLLRPDNIERIQKSAIEERKVADVSSMPSGLLDTFTAEDILDLLAFIESSKAIPATNQ